MSTSPALTKKKTLTELRHGTISLIILRLQDEYRKTSENILAIKSIKISNDLHGSDIIPTF